MTVEKKTPVFTDSVNLYTTRVYDGKTVDLTPTTDGDGTVSRVITNRETNEVLTSDLVDVGEYRAVYSVSEGKNYTEESVSYDFAITQAPLTITAEDCKLPDTRWLLCEGRRKLGWHRTEIERLPV